MASCRVIEDDMWRWISVWWVMALGTSLLASGCGGAQGPHLRFAQARPDEIEAARRSGEVVWYDFEAGDEVPLAFGLVGVAEGVTETPTRLIAQQPFSIVVFPDGRTMFSFDGHSLTDGTYAAQWSIALGAGPEGGRAAIVLYIGRPGEVPSGLRR